MLNSLDDRLNEFENKRIRDNAEEIGERILEKYGFTLDMFDEYEIRIQFLDRGYYTDEHLKELEEEYIAECEALDEESEAFYCEEMDWSVSCTGIIELDEGVIKGISIEHQAYGDSGLGDYDPEEIYTEDEHDRINKALFEFLQAVILPE